MERARAKPTASLTAYDCFLRALAALRIPTKPGLEEGLALCRQAITLDPNYASAYGVAAWCCMQRLAHGWAAEGDHKAGAEFARHAIEAGGDDPTALSTAALALGMLSGDLGLHLHQPRVRLVSFGDVSVDVGAEIIDPLQRCVGHSIEPSRREVAELLDVIAEGDDDVVSRVIQSRAFFRSPSIGSTAQLMSTASCVVLARSFTSSARR
jgi:hypothetical protein